LKALKILQQHPEAATAKDTSLVSKVAEAWDCFTLKY